MNLNNNILQFVNLTKPKCIFVDQLRFGIATILASISFSKKIDVILVPHGSISIPDSLFSKFILPICARGLIYSRITNYVVSQSKISNDAIKYYDNSLKILKSKPILFGIKKKIKNISTKNKFVFLHASTPKSLSKWPWIYENYSEYIDNIQNLIKEINKLKDIHLIIRFREGPECNLQTFKKLIDIKNNNFIEISKNKNFFDDLNRANCLVSFSSTAIEESLSLNKKILIYSNNKKYKHINYKLNENSIFYANNKNISNKIPQIIKSKDNINNDILWDEESIKKQDLKNFL